LTKERLIWNLFTEENTVN